MPLGNKFFFPIAGETWATHFESRGWTTIQDQIDDGYPKYAQPTATDGELQLVHDFGALVSASTLITLSYQKMDVAGTVTVTPRIHTSTDGTTWTSHTSGETRVYANNFQYVKVELDAVAADDTSFCWVKDVRVLLTTKEGTISGTATTDGSGFVTVDITGEFIDVNSITLTPKYNASYSVVAVYDFTDVANPTGFDIYTYRGDTGAALGGVEVSYLLKGVKT